MKYKLAAHVILRDMQGDDHAGRVVDASRDHVTVYCFDNGRSYVLRDADVIASHLRFAPCRSYR